MAKFIKRILVYLLLVLTAFLAVKIYTFRYKKKNFSSAFVDKLHILANNKTKRKIILIGGSSVGFGMSAEQIQRETGIPAINVGQLAGFGLIDFEDFILENLTKDDIIIFSLEWIFYDNPAYRDTATLDNLINNNLAYGFTIGKPLHTLKALLSSIPAGEMKASAALPDSIEIKKLPYVYNCINANGDIISHCNVKPMGPKPYTIRISGFDIKEFLRTFKYIGACKTLIVFPPTQEKVYNDNKKGLINIQNTLVKQRLTVLDAVMANVYKDSCFFDAEYHLTCQVRAARTEKIIGYLKENYLKRR